MLLASLSALPLFALCLISLSSGHLLGQDVTTVAVPEGSDAILECSASPVKSLEQELFDWRKDEKTKEVFMYNKGLHYNNGHTGQDDQFKGRVSHFQDQLINGNASIIIRNTKIEDSGNYSCVFPFPQEQRFNVTLIVGVASEPCVSIYDVSESGVQLMCEAKGAHPQPELQWMRSNGSVLPAEETEVLEKEGRFDVTLQTTVKSSDGSSFRCVVKQKRFHHEIGRNITVSEKLFEKTFREVDPGSCLSSGLGGFIGGFILAAGLAVLAAPVYIRKRYLKGCHQPTNDHSEQLHKLNPPQPVENDPRV